MKKITLFRSAALLAVVFLLSTVATAQPRVSVGAGAGLARGTDRGRMPGVGANVSVAAQWRGVVVQAQAADVSVQRWGQYEFSGSRAERIGTEWGTAQYSYAVDGGLAFSLRPSVGLVAGAGLRRHWVQDRPYRTAASPYLHTSVLVGRPDGLRLQGRVEFDGAAYELGPKRVQVGVLVPLTR